MAAELLLSPLPAHQPDQTSDLMSYDFEPTAASTNVELPDHAARENPKDLEAIVLILELAAIRLTEHPDATFTSAQLIKVARDLSGDFKIEESDIKIVLGKAGFLKKVGGQLQMR